MNCVKNSVLCRNKDGKPEWFRASEKMDNDVILFKERLKALEYAKSLDFLRYQLANVDYKIVRSIHSIYFD
jgi:hypothetical protein